MTTATVESPKRLDATKAQAVQYCIPIWLRDEQVKANCEREDVGRIEQHHGLRDEPIAVVCYGPSLAQTWERVKDFKYIITCSGAHRFLVERGIVPTWHVEVDPRKHKVELIGPPHKAVEYLIASACHPKVFDHLRGFNVKLWHIFDLSEEKPVLPRGEWWITGGCGAGLRAMTLARFLGFREQHIFGMDGSEGATGKHAAEHPNQARKCDEVEWGGRTFKTTPAFLEAARMTFHELDELGDVKPTFYGDGLVQAMAKDWTPKPKKNTSIAYNFPLLISPEMAAMSAAFHKTTLTYGAGGAKYAPAVKGLVESGNFKSVLDYGCGKGYLGAALDFPIWEYDPAIPGKDKAPRPADLVVCTDVLEHVEADRINYVLDDLRRCVKKAGYFVIHTGAAEKTFPDGRNTHLIQEGPEWWKVVIGKFFTITRFEKQGHEWHVAVLPQQKVKDSQSVAPSGPVVVPDAFDKRSHKLVLEDWIRVNGWKRGAEVGVMYGATYFHLLKNAPDLTLYGVDLWAPVPAADEQYAEGGRSYKHFQLPEHYENIKRRVEKDFKGRGILLRGDSAAMAAQVPDASLDFAFIDGDHRYEGVKKDIIAWRPKVRPGGCLCGHDIGQTGVRKAVDETCPGWKEHKQQVWAILV